ncbi:MAG: hypothetical protein NTZ10_02675 [Candidatus Saganbacteria bacterium]|nr:hypothetical protein [Candidatus Saganbacteria bacterium]
MNLRRVLAFSLILVIVSALPAFAASSKSLASDRPVLADIIKIGSNAAVPAGMTVKSVVAVGGSVAVAGEVTGDVVAVGGSVILRPSARVNGKVAAVGGVVKKAPGAKVAGEITEVTMPQSFTCVSALGTQYAPSVVYMATVFAALLSFLGVLALGIAAGLLFPRRVGWVSVAVERHPIKSFLWGLLWIILIIPICALLVVSIMGIPLIIVEIVAYGLALVLGYIAASQIIGKKLLSSFKRYNQPMVTEIIWGIVLLALIGLVPVLGQIVSAIVAIIAVGACWMTRYGEGI